MDRTQGIFADPGRIAPSIDKQWRDDFIVELRLLSVPGDDIGDALMTVESHVAESGEPARDVFGEPKAYAREIAEATGTVGRGGSIGPATVVGIVLGLVGMLVSSRAVAAMLDSGPVEITSGELVGLGVLLLLTGSLFFTPTLRVVLDHPVLAALLPALATGVLVGIFLLLSEPLFEVPATPLAAVGVVVLVVSAVTIWVGDRDSVDQVTAPGQAPPPSVGARLVPALVMPTMTLLLLAVIWVMHAIAA